MQDAVAGARRVWTVDHSGGNSPITRRLYETGWLAAEFDHNGLHLALLGLPAMPQQSLPAGVKFGPSLELSAAELVGGSGEGAGTTYEAGDTVGVTTHWQVLGGVQPLKFSLRLRDATGYSWASADYVPLNGLLPTETWQPGEATLDRRALVLPPDLPPGTYDLALLLYDPVTGAVLPEDQPDGRVLASLNVLPATQPPAVEDLPIPVRSRMSLGDELELLGYGVEPDPIRGRVGGHVERLVARPQAARSRAAA